MEGGTEAFPDLGSHCQHPLCHQLDFLPFSCNSCHNLFCLQHRSYKSHDCPNSDSGSRKVMVCEICSLVIETTGHSQEEEKKILEKHQAIRDCDPKKKKKPACPVRRCKEALTFSNTSTCNICRIQVCLRHRFHTDHNCGNLPLRSPTAAGNNKFLDGRSGKDCGNSVTAPTTPPAVQAC